MVGQLLAHAQEIYPWVLISFYESSLLEVVSPKKEYRMRETLTLSACANISTNTQKKTYKTEEKSCIQETPTQSTDADRSTNTD